MQQSSYAGVMPMAGEGLGWGDFRRSALEPRLGESGHSYQNFGTLKRLISEAARDVPNILRFACSLLSMI
jgi:hypothetical protein